MTLGSLFDGSGGFPLAGAICGIKPLWASEIEPFPIRVTTRRFPNIKHYGDVSLINGADVPPVDIITFGSPCTDLSVAGKRGGIEAERSGLFFQAIRIIKEMREATNGRYPAFAVWENVPGAFSSNRGEDFKAVLDAVIGIVEPHADLPKIDKWPKADCYVGNGWSVAYRVIDAQYFGVPQRRRRIFLVAEFGGERAHKILFEPKGVSRDFKAGISSWQRTAGGVESGVGEAIPIENHPMDSRFKVSDDGNIQTLHSRMGTGGNNVPMVMVIGNGQVDQLGLHDKVGALNCMHGQQCVVYGIDRAAFNQGQNALYKPGILEEQQPTLTAKGPGAVAQPASFYPQMKAESQCFRQDGTANTLVNGTNPGFQNGLVDSNHIVRRLTPTECARLQGFPDWWCDGLETENPTEADIEFWTEVFETHRRIMGGSRKSRNRIIKFLQNPRSDSAEYKMWGNGVALPCVVYVLKGIIEEGRL